MDLATLLGLVGAIGIVLAAMMFGGSALVFVNIPSLLIVLGGTFMVVMIKFSMSIEEIHSPPLLITSLRRSVTCR